MICFTDYCKSVIILSSCFNLSLSQNPALYAAPPTSARFPSVPLEWRHAGVSRSGSTGCHGPTPDRASPLGFKPPPSHSTSDHPALPPSAQTPPRCHIQRYPWLLRLAKCSFYTWYWLEGMFSCFFTDKNILNGRIVLQLSTLGTITYSLGDKKMTDGQCNISILY